MECLANAALQNNVAAQPLAQRGTLTQVPVTEANNTLRIGRFGWKAQHASLVSFSGDAYLNEMGITNPFDGFGCRSSSAPDAGTNENPATTPSGVVNVTFPSLFDLPKDREIVTYCACPADESSITAAGTLQEAGFTRVRVLKGGWSEWLKAKGPVQPK